MSLPPSSSRGPQGFCRGFQGSYWVCPGSCWVCPGSCWVCPGSFWWRPQVAYRAVPHPLLLISRPALYKLYYTVRYLEASLAFYQSHSLTLFCPGALPLKYSIQPYSEKTGFPKSIIPLPKLNCNTTNYTLYSTENNDNSEDVRYMS